MQPSLPTLDDLDVAGKRVFVRCDLNVPLDDGHVTDDLRIRAAVPTLERLLERGARLVVCSHLGRPKGQVVEALRMQPVGQRLAQVLGHPVEILDEVVGKDVTAACMSPADVVLLENVRFEPGESKNDPALADQLAALADVYVNDAFGSAHRAHASTVGVAERLPAAAGLLLADEVAKLTTVLEDAKKPFVAVLGGAKVSDKLAVIGNLLERVDAMCIGGAMAFTLLKAQGKPVGRSLVEEERVDEVAQVLERAEQAGVEILLPSDVVATDSLDEDAAYETVSLNEIGERMGVDIGPASAQAFAAMLADAKTILWNGPMGIFEREPYSHGTKTVAEAVVRATSAGAYSVVGGGDSAAALKALDMTEGVSHLSTGGGASLQFLEGKVLPGVAALLEKETNR